MYTYLKSIFDTIFSIPLICLLWCRHLLWHIAQDERKIPLWQCTPAPPESDQKNLEIVAGCNWSRHTKMAQSCIQNNGGPEKLTHMFGLDLNTTNQLCVIPVIEGQAIHWSDTQQETTIDAWKYIIINLHKTINNSSFTTFSMKCNERNCKFLHFYHICIQNFDKRFLLPKDKTVYLLLQSLA